MGPNFLHILTERVQFYVMVHFLWARALPTKSGPHPATPRARPVLPYGTFFLGSRASNQTRTPPGHPERARPVLPYGTFFLGSRASNKTQTPPSQPSRHVLIPYLRGDQVP